MSVKLGSSIDWTMFSLYLKAQNENLTNVLNFMNALFIQTAILLLTIMRQIYMIYMNIFIVIP